MTSRKVRLPAGVRWQATAAAGAVVAAALVVGSVALVMVLHSSLTTTLQASLVALATEDARTLADHGVGALALEESERGEDGILVQVIDDSGAVVYTSEKARSTTQVSLRPAPGETLVAGRTLLPVPWHLAAPLSVAHGVNADGHSYVVLALASQQAQEAAVRTVWGLLLGGIPLLVALAGLVTWWRVGRALGSVEDIRRQVETIETAHVTQRVPVPPTRDEVADLARTMNGMLQRLEASDRARRRFVADASHELRSPLATLTAALEVAEGDDTGRTWPQLAPVLTSETRRMTRLVEDLLLLSQADDQVLVPAAEDVDLDDLADLECRRLRRLTPLPVTLSAAPVRVRGDEHKLAQLLRNVLDNAARSARSRVAVSVTRRADVAVITVEDDGDGIPPAQRERVFERFVRLDESRSRGGGGAGLGLSIVHEIAVAHGGSVHVTTSTLGGAAFEIRLPVVAVRDPHPSSIR
ncbi:MAG: sensor histidine kinase [Dermatophilaceae bacterium]